MGDSLGHPDLPQDCPTTTVRDPLILASETSPRILRAPEHGDQQSKGRAKLGVPRLPGTSPGWAGECAAGGSLETLCPPPPFLTRKPRPGWACAARVTGQPLLPVASGLAVPTAGLGPPAEAKQ